MLTKRDEIPSRGKPFITPTAVFFVSVYLCFFLGTMMSLSSLCASSVCVTFVCMGRGVFFLHSYVLLFWGAAGLLWLFWV